MTVPGENVTDRYAKSEKKETFLLSIRVVDANEKRVAVAVAVTGDTKHGGTSRGESADLNDFLSFDLKPGMEYVVKVGDATKSVTAGKAGESRVLEIELAKK